MPRHIIDSPVKIRIALAVGWTIASVYVLLLPGDTPVIEGLAALLKNAGFMFGHFAGFAILAGLWWWALIAFCVPRWALLGAVLIAFVVGLSTEIAQLSVKGRGGDVLDIFADLSGAVAAAVWIFRARGGNDG